MLISPIGSKSTTITTEKNYSKYGGKRTDQSVNEKKRPTTNNNTNTNTVTATTTTT